MILVNVGDYTINVEHVACFHIEGEDTVVIFDAIPGQGSDDRYSVKLTGEASKRMQAWLKKNSEGIREDNPGFAITAESQ